MENFIHGNGQAALNLCGCGRLHFTYGPITLHFEQEEFVAYANEVSRLAESLRQLADGRSPVLLPGLNGRACH